MRSFDDSLLATRAFRARLQAEAEFDGGNGMFQMVAVRDGGLFVGFDSGTLAPGLTPEQQCWAEAMLTVLNREIHHDGAWVIQFTHPATNAVHGILMPGAPAVYERIAFLWMDADGDVQFTHDTVSPFDAVWAEGPMPWVERCEQSWAAWDHLMNRVLERKDGETFKRAKGEQAPSASRPRQPMPEAPAKHFVTGNRATRRAMAAKMRQNPVVH